MDGKGNRAGCAFHPLESLDPLQERQGAGRPPERTAPLDTLGKPAGQGISAEGNDLSAMAVYGLDQRGEKAVEQAGEFLGPPLRPQRIGQAFHQRGEAADIGKEHRPLSPFRQVLSQGQGLPAVQRQERFQRKQQAIQVALPLLHPTLQERVGNIPETCCVLRDA